MSLQRNEMTLYAPKTSSIIARPATDPVFADREMVYWGKSDGMGGDGT